MRKEVARHIDRIIQDMGSLTEFDEHGSRRLPSIADQLKHIRDYLGIEYPHFDPNLKKKKKK